ncbi:Uncharacterized response regulatory protein ypdB [Erwinia pyrifoliae DSM 12163]|nr:transcriptional regulator, probable fragment [Erwinia pyrifoliae Ep1/96]CAY73620.1 Uncharacterized response regulatory protein ypdB [Erwinia pyrifoliae DSM 12163]
MPGKRRGDVSYINDIYYAEAHEKLTFVYTRHEEYVMSMNMSEFCGSLPGELFFRRHRSYCINLSKIHESEPWFNNTWILKRRDRAFQVTVSRSRVKELRQLMRR